MTFLVNISEHFSLGSKLIKDVDQYQPGNPAGGLSVILSVVIRNIYIFSTIILFFMIFVGGLGMIINAGNTDKQKQSSKTISSAVTGFVIIFISYWLIKLIEIILGVHILDLN